MYIDFEHTLTCILLIKLTVHTLRYYERIGMIEPILRTDQLSENLASLDILLTSEQIERLSRA
ncbi:MerR family DNA-binding transcriptional regulator [Fontibacillus panacisegetis]|uniref:MerR family DNA-binding transcriptional regulator n=1 Tax=Fontibacillus solani TaxID=1572857 RepID=UPI0035E3F67E